jgi:uncharacterized membrane protein YphA (DoxX/SURF4 family)
MTASGEQAACGNKGRQVAARRPSDNQRPHRSTLDHFDALCARLTRREGRMNVLLWIVQGVLAAMFIVAGVMKVSQPRQRLIDTMGWPADFSDNAVKGIGAVEILAAIGLILPAVTGIASWLTPLAAVGLAVLMVGAAATHYRRKEPQMIVVTAVIFLLAVLVAWGRFGPYSF